ncbi:MAG: response regulator transcription factor [Acidobacteria bacterium]|nr:response regulator transcription factor [Acidobacteriota bacterium]
MRKTAARGAIMETETKSLPTILVAEDHEDTLKAIVAFLEKYYRDRYEVVGSVRDGMALVNEALKLAPDLAVVDVSMPKLNGIEATAELKQRKCSTKIVMLTIYSEPAFFRAAFDAGAVGYVLKTRMYSDLPLAVDAALRGERFTSLPLENRTE